MKIIALIQARMRSTRLPGKMLMDIAGKSLLRHVYDRVRGSKRLDGVTVCTSREMSDAPIAAACLADNIPVFRGSETDVLGRLAAAASGLGDCDAVIRVCGDNPLICPAGIDQICATMDAGGQDYVGFRMPNGTPSVLTGLGLFAEGVRVAALRAEDEVLPAGDSSREHVTTSLLHAVTHCIPAWLPVPARCENPALRFTVDTPEDLDLIREIFSRETAVSAFAAKVSPHAKVGLLDMSAARLCRHVLAQPDWLVKMEAGNATNPK